MIQKSNTLPLIRRGKMIAICAVVAVLCISMVPAVAATPTASCYSNKLQVSLSGPDHPAISTPVTYTATVANGVAPFTYTWTVDGLSQASTTSQLSYTFTTSGPHTVKVTVTDKSTPTQTDSATKGIYVTPPPKLEVSLSGPDHPAISTPVTYTATVANGVAPFTYTWTVDNVRQASTTSQLSYTFTTRGPHTVKVTVTDKSTPTQTDSATKWIYV